ncbi:MAG: M48 family metallopeptidase [Oscillospiraceae bacterium]|nr:M48 family metallopeptidase [Oscillospiraceae bacterium]
MDFEYTLKRSNRKTVAIQIHDGMVEVRAPHHTPIEAIERFIHSKTDWIDQKLSYSIEHTQRRKCFELHYGDHLLYRGELYPIVAKDGDLVGFDDGFYIPPDLSSPEIKEAVIQIYKLLAKRDITARVRVFADLLNLRPSTVRINSAKTRWGSCSAKGHINFSWLLIMAQDDVIDYIVLHELTHLVEMNHSADFWEQVRVHMPDYEERKDKLKVLQQRLNDEDW